MTLRWYPSIDYSSMQDPYKSGNWTFFRITTSETFVTSETGNPKFRFWSYCSQKSLWVFTRCSSQWNFERAWLIRPGSVQLLGCTCSGKSCRKLHQETLMEGIFFGPEVQLRTPDTSALFSINSSNWFGLLQILRPFDPASRLLRYLQYTKSV